MLEEEEEEEEDRGMEAHLLEGPTKCDETHMLWKPHPEQ